MTETVFSQQYGCNVDLYFGGEREKTFNHEYGPVKRTHFIITLVREGEASLFMDGRTLSFGAGDLIVMFPDTEYHYRAHGTWSIKWVGVGSADLDIFLKRRHSARRGNTQHDIRNDKKPLPLSGNALKKPALRAYLDNSRKLQKGDRAESGAFGRHTFLYCGALYRGG